MNVHVAMPAFNEAEGIGGFLEELNTELAPWQPAFTVVDDCSSDETSQAVADVAALGVAAVALRNAVNRGHGPSTLRALSAGLDSAAPFIIAIDGDGQFAASDVRRVLETLIESDSTDIVEGVRVNRNDPWFRKSVSFATQFLVWSKTREMPPDANTPLRAYRRDALASVLSRVPGDAMTPNLLISVLSRKGPLTTRQVAVTALPRRGTSEVGTTWGRGSRLLPSKRFMRFCLDAGRQWFATTPRQG